MTTLESVGPFKCIHRLPLEEDGRRRYVCPASGSCWLVIERDRERWEAFIINMFEGEQSSLIPALSGGAALISPRRSNIPRCGNGGRLPALHVIVLFLFKVSPPSSIFDLFHAKTPRPPPLYFACMFVEDASPLPSLTRRR